MLPTTWSKWISTVLVITQLCIYTCKWGQGGKHNEFLELWEALCEYIYASISMQVYLCYYVTSYARDIFNLLKLSLSLILGLYFQVHCALGVSCTFQTAVCYGTSHTYDGGGFMPDKYQCFTAHSLVQWRFVGSVEGSLGGQRMQERKTACAPIFKWTKSSQERVITQWSSTLFKKIQPINFHEMPSSPPSLRVSSFNWSDVSNNLYAVVYSCTDQSE